MDSGVENGVVSGYKCKLRSASKYKQEGSGFVEYLESILTTPLHLRTSTVYNYQINAVLDTRNYLKKEGTMAQPALIVAPTGAGKSGMVAMLPYALESKKVLVLSPSLAVTNQLASAFGRGPCGFKESYFWKSKLFQDLDELEKFLENPNVIKEPKDFLEGTDVAKLVIVNAQKFGGQSGASLVNKNVEVVRNARQAFQSFDTLIVDEAHHYPAQTWKNIVEQFRGKIIIFLTATPYRRGQDGKQVEILGQLQKITHEIKKETVEGKTIRKSEFDEIVLDPNDPIGNRRTILLNKENIKKIGEKILQILYDHDRRMPSVKHKAMCFVNTKKEANWCASWLGGATFCTSDKSTDQNKTNFEDPDGPYRILVSCGKLVEGYDNPMISVCVILRKVGSSNMFHQFVGRCLRRGPDDTVVAAIRSLPCFEQRRMWNDYNKVIAEADPEDDPDDAELESGMLMDVDE